MQYVPEYPLAGRLARQEDTTRAQTAHRLLANPDHLPELFLSDWLAKSFQKLINILIAHNTTPLRDTRNSLQMRLELPALQRAREDPCSAGFPARNGANLHRCHIRRPPPTHNKKDKKDKNPCMSLLRCRVRPRTHTHDKKDKNDKNHMRSIND